tara:strand:+ start:1073 stop:1354 length:282 start_codon:yes stop_codon:yes gene_type:complete
MDFLEEIELYNSAMDNAYNLITGRLTVDELFIEFDENEDEEGVLPLPFNPFLSEKFSNALIDVVIDHFSSIEEYEKCAELVKIKEKNAVKRHQ